MTLHLNKAEHVSWVALFCADKLASASAATAQTSLSTTTITEQEITTAAEREMTPAEQAAEGHQIDAAGDCVLSDAAART